MPGRDRSKILDTLGWGIALISLLGIAVHGLGRAITASRKRG
jgi:hypothetical protein